MPTVDLHCHSTCSDGSLTPTELVRQAARSGVDVLALTDHDTVSGLAEAQLAATACGITLIPALELSVDWLGYNIHVVGLGIDPTHPVLQEGLAQQSQARSVRGHHIAERLSALGITGSYEGALALAQSPDTLSRTHFSQWLLAEGHVGSLQQAFDRYLGPRKPAAVPLTWVDLATGVSWITAAGGAAVLAHPGRYDMSRTKLRRLLADFQLAGGTALEVATATEKPDIVRYLGLLSQQMGLMASQGSDYHGRSTPWLALGRFPPLPAGCIPVWPQFLHAPAHEITP